MGSLKYVRKVHAPFLILILGQLQIFAQEIQVPVKIQVPIFLKILAFDKNLMKQAGNEIVIGILYQRKYMKSRLIKDEIISELEKLGQIELLGLPLRYVAVDFKNAENLERIIDEGNIDIIYVTPLRAVDIGEIAEVTRKKKVLTFSSVPDYVEAGLSVGLGVKGEKPRIIINLSAAKAEGTDFSSRLLMLAKVIE